MDFDESLGEVAMEALLARETRILTCFSGHPWKITCFNITWKKFDFLTNEGLWGDKAWSQGQLLEPILKYERERNYDLNLSFAYWVVTTYEDVRLGVVAIEADR